jgi:hypothetical protein
MDTKYQQGYSLLEVMLSSSLLLWIATDLISHQLNAQNHIQSMIDNQRQEFIQYENQSIKQFENQIYSVLTTNTSSKS